MARKRRGRGEGSIYQRADGTWVANASLGYRANGKRIRKEVTGKTKRSVQEKIGRLLTSDGNLDITKITVADYLARWLNNTAKKRTEPTTHQRYEQIIRLHINPYIGHLRLAKLVPISVEQFFVQQEEKGVSPRNRELSGVVLQAACRNAVRLRLIPYNPVADVQKPKSPKPEMQVWTPDEAQLFMETAKTDRLYSLFVLAITGGMRQGELFALRWTDIDFEAGAVSVTKTLEEIKGKLRIKQPKTSGSRRRVTLPKFALAALHEHRKAMVAEGYARSPVFCDTEGGWLRKSNFRRRTYLPLLKKAEVPKLRFHDMRHAQATFLLLKGVHPKVVSERLGHANIQVTLNSYSHVMPSLEKEAADKLDELFG